MQNDRLLHINNSATTCASLLTESSNFKTVIRDISDFIKEYQRKRTIGRPQKIALNNQSPCKLKSKRYSVEKAVLELPSAMFSKLKVGNFSSTIRRSSAFSTPNTNSSIARRKNMSIDSRYPIHEYP